MVAGLPAPSIRSSCANTALASSLVLVALMVPCLNTTNRWNVRLKSIRSPARSTTRLRFRYKVKRKPSAIRATHCRIDLPRDRTLADRSMTRWCSWLVEAEPQMFVEISPQLAKLRGIETVKKSPSKCAWFLMGDRNGYRTHSAVQY